MTVTLTHFPRRSDLCFQFKLLFLLISQHTIECLQVCEDALLLHGSSLIVDRKQQITPFGFWVSSKGFSTFWNEVQIQVGQTIEICTADVLDFVLNRFLNLKEMPAICLFFMVPTFSYDEDEECYQENIFYTSFCLLLRSRPEMDRTMVGWMENE